MVLWLHGSMVLSTLAIEQLNLYGVNTYHSAFHYNETTIESATFSIEIERFWPS